MQAKSYLQFWPRSALVLLWWRRWHRRKAWTGTAFYQTSRSGSATGEHGIGVEKISLMEYAFTPDTLSAMRDVRRVFNPGNTLNPSKVLPSNRGCIEVGKAFSFSAKAIEHAQKFLRRGAPM